MVVKYEDGEYKFDFAEKVEGYTPEVKEDPIVFSVFPPDTCSLTNTGSEQKSDFNDAFYVASSPGLIDIEAQSAQYGNNRIRLTSSNLKFSKDEVDYLTVSNTGVLSNLKVGTDSYKLVFLNNVNLVTEQSDAGVY